MKESLPKNLLDFLKTVNDIKLTSMDVNYRYLFVSMISVISL